MKGLSLKKKINIHISLILFVATLSVASITPGEAKKPEKFVPGEWIIGVESTEAGVLSDIEGSGGLILKQSPAVKAVQVRVHPSKEGKFIGEIRGKKWARYVERNYIYEVTYTPNDPEWNSLWNMQIIQAEEAFNINRGSTSILVAVIDTGIDYTHEDLSGHYIATGYDWVNDDNDPMDDYGHGTRCAGILGAVIDNGLGIAGVAQASIMAEKVLGSDGRGTISNIAQGIIHAADSGAKVISISLGGYYGSSLLRDACEYAWNKGVILVGAAGNNNIENNFYPAGFDTVIAVAATDRFDGKASYSNWGGWIEVSAPGGDGSDYHDRILSTYIGNMYVWGAGTSAATPHVAGLAALVLSYEPGLSNQQIRDHIRSTVDDLGLVGKDDYFGYGRINAFRALDEIGLLTLFKCTRLIGSSGQIRYN